MDKGAIGGLFNIERDNKKGTEIIAVTSGKGGVGKTNLSVNLSLLLRQFDKKVLLIDADIHLGNVDLFLGVTPPYTIADFVLKNKSIDEIIYKCPQGIDLLPASSVVRELIESEEVALKKIGEAFRRFHDDYDVMVIDTGAGVSRTVMSFVLSADKVVIVVTSDPASVADTYGMIKIIKHTVPSMPIVLVVNMAKNLEEGESLFKKLNLMVQKFLNSKLIFGGCLLKDEQISRAIKMQTPFIQEYPNSTSSLYFKLIVRKLMSVPSRDRALDMNIFDRLVGSREIILGGE
ncbi:MAG: MinD/ParA family protein [Candidatus Neomarinimicrobiota bacterium]|nr:MAG: MinD/ParA family protein [Candidatus Neomarinimicrobiota bacterium]